MSCSGSATASPRPDSPVAPLGRRLITVLHNRELGAYRVITLGDDESGPEPRAGQFYMLAAASFWGGDRDERPFLARAFSVLRPRRADTAHQIELDFMLEAVGPGTERLARLRTGESVWVSGPFGRGFWSPDPGTRPMLVGGGVGTAPLAALQDQLAAEGDPGTALLGFRDRAHALGESLLRDVRVATDDGSVGHCGPVTDLLSSALAQDDTWTVFACGPPGMLEAVRDVCAGRGVSAQIAVEAGMACGFGACYGCVLETDLGYARVCVDGPVFAATTLTGRLGTNHGETPHA